MESFFNAAAERVRLVVANATCIENESGMNWEEGTEGIHIHRLLSKMSQIPTLKFQKLKLHFFQKLIRTEARKLVTMHDDEERRIHSIKEFDALLSEREAILAACIVLHPSYHGYLSPIFLRNSRAKRCHEQDPRSEHQRCRIFVLVRMCFIESSIR